MVVVPAGIRGAPGALRASYAPLVMKPGDKADRHSRPTLVRLSRGGPITAAQLRIQFSHYLPSFFLLVFVLDLGMFPFDGGLS